MRRTLFTGLAATTLAAALALAPAAVAAPSTAVTISVLTEFDPASVDDPFIATSGVVCASGTVSTPFGLFVGGQSGTHGQILVGKHFVCPDGTFDLLLRVRLDFASGDTAGTWSVVGGTGAYRLLHGSGTITGDGLGDAILDAYTGKMAIA